MGENGIIRILQHNQNQHRFKIQNTYVFVSIEMYDEFGQYIIASIGCSGFRISSETHIFTFSQ